MGWELIMKNLKLFQAEPYHAINIEAAEELYKSKYIGSWCIRDGENWSEVPVEVFYQPNPDTSKGYSHYFGIYVESGIGGYYHKVMVTNAESAFSKDIIGIVDNDIVYVSRYRHDFVKTPSGFIIDGGRDYLRLGSDSNENSELDLVKVTVKDGEFIFNEIVNDEDE